MSNGEAGNYLPGDPRYGLSGEALKDYYRNKPARWARFKPCWGRLALGRSLRASITVCDGRRVLKVLDAVIKSDRSKEVVWLR